MATERALSEQPPAPLAGDRPVPAAIRRAMQRTGWALDILLLLLILAHLLAGLFAVVIVVGVAVTGDLTGVVALAILLGLLALTYTLPTLFLFRYRRAIRELCLHAREHDLLVALRAQRLLWGYCCVVMLVALAGAIYYAGYTWSNQAS